MTNTEQMAQIAIQASPVRKSVFRSPYLITALLLPLILMAWWLATTVTNSVPAILLPTPESVWQSFPRVVGAERFGDQVMRTLMEFTGGFALGASVGFFLGVLLSTSRRLRAAYLPFLSALEAIPHGHSCPHHHRLGGFWHRGKDCAGRDCLLLCRFHHNFVRVRPR